MISPHFPPDSTAATHRVRLLAPHLPSFGWHPTVLTVDERDYEGTLDHDLASLVPESLEVVRARAWSAGWTRRVGVGDLGIRALAGLWKSACALLSAREHDALYITIYPSYPALLGPALKRRFHIPFVLDYQDPWVGAWGSSVGGGPDGSPDLKSRLTRSVAQALEPAVLSRVDAVTAVSAATYEQALERARLPAPPVCATLPVGWDARDLDAIGSSPNPFFDPADGSVHLSYVGTVLPKGLPPLQSLLEAVQLMAEREPAMYGLLRIWFLGTSNQTAGTPAERVKPLARQYGVAPVINEVPRRVPYLEALRVLRDSTGVLLLGSTESHYTASKLYPALTAGRPLLAVFHERSNVVSTLRRVGRPPAVNLTTFAEGGSPSVEAIYEGLLSIARRPHLAALHFDLSAVQPYSAQALAKTLSHVLDGVAAKEHKRSTSAA